MKIALTGASGTIGQPLAAALVAAGHEVTALSRTPLPGTPHLPYDLAADPPPLDGHDALIHAAFDHVPGRYRGGEGDDPEGFRVRNLGGTLRLFEAARAAGTSRILFLSSRAVYGAYPAGTTLAEDLPPRPDTLYGALKLEAEAALAALPIPTASLRATGVYGPPLPGRQHKWAPVLAAYTAREPLAPATGTEVHADDLAAAALLLLTAPAGALSAKTFNLSDFALDRRDLCAAYTAATGRTGTLPPPSDPATVSAMTTDRLAALGWRPRGPAGLAPVLRLL